MRAGLKLGELKEKEEIAPSYSQRLEDGGKGGEALAIVG